MDSLTWLFQTLPLAGVQIETGDTGVCQCNLCSQRRKYPVSEFSWEDMALMYPIAANAVRAVAPGACVICETYSHPQPYVGPRVVPGFGDGTPPWAGEALAAFPGGAFLQWVGDNYLRLEDPAYVWTSDGSVASNGFRNILRVHFGTNWGWGAFRGEVALDWMAEFARRSGEAGFEAMSLFGEVSPFETGAELNYLALRDFASSWNPASDLASFLERVAAPRLGGLANAQDFLAFAGLLDRRHPERLGEIPRALAQIYGRMSSLQPDAARRWCWLANRLASYQV